jgi:hypothetical protein
MRIRMREQENGGNAMAHIDQSVEEILVLARHGALKKKIHVPGGRGPCTPSRQQARRQIFLRPAA